ncbi:DNA binding domain-containing protein, excisionase family [Catalinimonas alkaloidigena]|uniref:DNA binding domain-containing protein, excisionase family n=1 Tax=Catalinimonas alkaloidigena TaxID=1075417 RepID=A0A1G9QIS5_9BACT|nr:DNA binding domain-containing protein, excisionase family [Catalinimonas alkaloidigena]
MFEAFQLELAQFIEQLVNERVAQALQQHEHKCSTLDKKSLLTIDEAAAYTGYQRSTLYSKHSIPRVKRDGRIFFPRQELDDWMAGNAPRSRSK